MTHHEQDDSPNEIVIFLRALVGEPADQPTPDELAASVRRLLPAGPRRLYAAASLAWSIVGHRLFAHEISPVEQDRVEPQHVLLPGLKRVRVEPQHVPVALAMLRTRGNISAAAAMLGISRRALRDGLRRMGAYPWHKGQRGENELAPGLAFVLRELPDVVEDGTRGVVWFRLDEQHGIGPAWLERGDQSDRLFRGWWVDRETAEAYAREHDHAFHCEGAVEADRRDEERVEASDEVVEPDPGDQGDNGLVGPDEGDEGGGYVW